jgi:hypothetical protein
MSSGSTPPAERAPDEFPAIIETQTVSNRYGTVTNLAVYCDVKKNFFGQAEREDLAMRHVVSARLETSHRPALGSILVLIGIALPPSVTILGIVILAAGIYLILRKPIVLVTADDGVGRPSAGSPWRVLRPRSS